MWAGLLAKRELINVSKFNSLSFFVRIVTTISIIMTTGHSSDSHRRPPYHKQLLEVTKTRGPPCPFTPVT